MAIGEIVNCLPYTSNWFIIMEYFEDFVKDTCNKARKIKDMEKLMSDIFDKDYKKAVKRNVAPLKWVGGKSLLAKEIIPMIPKHNLYGEVFAGAAWILFKKPESNIEVINDINSDIVNFYEVIRDNIGEFIKQARLPLFSREVFNSFVSNDTKRMNKYQKAWRFFYILKSCFGAKLKAPTFQVSYTANKGSKSFASLLEYVKGAHERLSGVVIENMNYTEFIQKYDKKDTFFYVDLPYIGLEHYYNLNPEKEYFVHGDHKKLQKCLSNIQGKFLLSINDCDYSRKLYKDFYIKPLNLKYSLSAEKEKCNSTELLISNYKHKTLLG